MQLDGYMVMEGTAIGPQPDAAVLRDFAGQGGRTVIDFRPADEVEGSNEELVRSAGLRYVNLPVRSGEFTDAHVARFEQAMGSHPGPFLLSCATGARAGATMLMSGAVQRGWSSRQALDTASAMGFDCDAHPAIKDFFVDYIDRHSTASTSP